MKCWPICMVLVAAAVAAGCGKSAPAPSANTATTPQPSGEVAIPQEAPPTRGADLRRPYQAAAIPDNGNPSATLSALSTELRNYVARTRSAPKTFEEFQTKAQLRAPPPPAGKKYAIQQGEVVLVKN